jgi:hypothetical protein
MRVWAICPTQQVWLAARRQLSAVGIAAACPTRTHKEVIDSRSRVEALSCRDRSRRLTNFKE